MSALNYDIVHREYVTHGLSDAEIAAKYGVTKSTVAHMRRYHGIETREQIWQKGHYIVLGVLQHLGYSVLDKREKNGTSRFNFLVNRLVKVQVLTAQLSKGKQTRWFFSIKPRKQDEISGDNRYFKQLSDGRWVKDLSKSCDVIVLCCLNKGDTKFLVIPSSVVPSTQSGFSVTFPLNRWKKYENRWDIIDKIHRKRTGGTTV
jgi:hypothetical protein